MRQADPSHPVRLSARQCKIVQVIADSVRDTGYAPSFQEIGDAVGLASRSSVAHQLEALQRKGYLTHEAGRPRAIALRDPALRAAGPEVDQFAEHRLARVPVAGDIAAGRGKLVPEPVEQAAAENILALPEQLVGQGNLIALKVHGDSMIDAAIADGDLVVVRRESDVENGDIVAAMVEGQVGYEATVKTFKMADGHVWLIPHNPAFEPRIADDAHIIGKVVSVLRRL